MFENLDNLKTLYGDKVFNIQIIFKIGKNIVKDYTWTISQIPTQLDKLLELDEEVSMWYSNTIQYNNTCCNPDIYTRYLYLDLVICKQNCKIQYNLKIKPESKPELKPEPEPEPEPKSLDIKSDKITKSFETVNSDDLIFNINIDLVTQYLNLEKESESNDRALYESCDNLLKQIYGEYLESNSLISEKEEEIKYLKNFIPCYNTRIIML